MTSPRCGRSSGSTHYTLHRTLTAVVVGDSGALVGEIYSTWSYQRVEKIRCSVLSVDCIAVVFRPDGRLSVRPSVQSVMSFVSDTVSR